MNTKAGSFPHKIAHRLEEAFDDLNARFRDRFGYRHAIRVVPYTGFGTTSHVQMRGRVLSDPEVEESDSTWSTARNVMGMLGRYKTDEVPNAKLVVRYGGEEKEVESDKEGYFHAKFDLTAPHRPEGLLESYEVELVRPHKNGGQNQTTFEGRVQVPDAARFGVISDIDDTVVHTGATNFLRHASTVLLNNARTRSPFPGVAAFYNALRNEQGRAENPLFYVSSSPWNLYDFFTDFMNAADLPHGTMFLKDFGVDRDRWLKTSHAQYKAARIREVLDTYPQLGFILIGDSGQEDPEIYRDLVKQDPERILAVYLRDVTSGARDSAVRKIAKQIRSFGPHCALAKDSLEAAEHAAENGWIAPDDLDRVRRHVYNADLEKRERRYVGSPAEASF